MKIQAYSAGKSAPHAIKLSSNESPFPPPIAIRLAMLLSLKHSNRYPPAIHDTLHQSIANRYNIDPNQIVLGNGSDELITNITRLTLSHSHEQVLISEHTFSIYTIATQLMGARISYVNTKNGHCSLDNFLAMIGSNTKLLFVCNPNNPTGCYLPLYQIEDFLHRVPHHITVVLDHAYHEFVTTETIQYKNVLALHPRVIILKTFSKIASLAGVRIGYALGNKHHIAELSHYRMPFNINQLAIKAVHAYLSTDYYEKKILTYILKQRTKLTTFLTSRNIHFYPSQANFLCIDARSLLQHIKTLTHKAHTKVLYSIQSKTTTPSQKVFDYFAKHGIMIRSLESFDMPNHVRVSIGTPREMKKFFRAIS